MPNTAKILIRDDDTIEGKIVKLFGENESTQTITSTKRINIPHSAECIHSLDDIRAIQNYYLSRNRFRDYMMFTVGIATGFRISDLVSLNISDVIYEDGTFKEYIDIIEKKTGKASHNVNDKCVITEAIREAVGLYLAHHIVKDYNEPLIYSRKPNKFGEHRIREESGWRIIKEAQRALGMNYNLGSHSMRKTFANIAACCSSEANIDMNKLLQIQHMLKHSDYRTTMKYLNLNSIFTSNARIEVSDFILGKTPYNNLNDALIKNKEDTVAGKLDKILDILINLEE